MDIAYLCRWLLDPIVVLRAFYLAASALILIIQAVPALKCRFLAYGSRATTPSSGGAVVEPSSTLDQLLDYLAGLRVPHSYFTHFYVVSVVSSLVWGLAGGPFLQSSGMTRAVQIAWLLMLLQGVRRVLESYAYTSTSKSPMWFGHWILGLLFYLTINVAIWIEDPLNSTEAVRSGQNEAFSWKLVAVPPAILVCHGLQHSYHAYLYRLRTTHHTYQLPSHPLFPNLLCPHYTCEVLIYLLLSFLTAPAGQSVNSTLLCATIFVLVNLAVTAAGTKEWYERQFGVGKVRGRKRMVPWLW